jgi:hypothetical protein
MDVAIAADFDFEGFGDGINAFCADAVEAAGDLIGAFTEFPAGVEVRHDEFESGDLIFWVDIDGDTAAVIFDGAGAIEVEGDGNIFTITGQGFIDGVIDDFEDAMVEAAFESIADVHVRAFTDAFEAFEFLDFGGVVGIVGHSLRELAHCFDIGVNGLMGKSKCVLNCGKCGIYCYIFGVGAMDFFSAFSWRSVDFRGVAFLIFGASGGYWRLIFYKKKRFFTSTPMSEIKIINNYFTAGNPAGEPVSPFFFFSVTGFRFVSPEEANSGLPDGEGQNLVYTGIHPLIDPEGGQNLVRHDGGNRVNVGFQNLV